MAGSKNKEFKSTATNTDKIITVPKNHVNTVSKISKGHIFGLIESIKLFSKSNVFIGSQQNVFTEIINELIHLFGMIQWLKNALTTRNYRNIVIQIYQYFNAVNWRKIAAFIVDILNTTGKFVKLDVDTTDDTTKISLLLVPDLGNI